MHRIVEDRPEVQALRDEQADLEGKRRSFAARQAAETVRHEAERKAHAAAVRTATLAGEAPPPAPEPPRAVGDYVVFEQEALRLRLAEQEVLRLVAVPVLAELQAREGELLADVGELLAQIDAIVAEVAEVVETSRVLPVDGLHPARSVDLATVIDAARRGTSLIDHDPAPQPTTFVRSA